MMSDCVFNVLSACAHAVPTLRSLKWLLDIHSAIRNKFCSKLCGLEGFYVHIIAHSQNLGCGGGNISSRGILLIPDWELVH